MDSSRPGSPKPGTTIRLRSSAAPARQDVEELAASLVEEMVRLWRQGQRPRAEVFFARYPYLWDHPEAAADLIYEEVCLRQEHGEEVAVEEVVGRFPQWRPQLELLLGCQRLLGPPLAAPRFPEPGDLLGDFLLLAELGRGAQGRVFLAKQASLGDRPVVLKLTPCDGHEHLSLARLQHTFIAPLYSAQDYPDRGLRALCMPYFGGATLAQLLAALPERPPGRTGRGLLEALTRLRPAAPVSVPAGGPAQQALARASYVESVCGIGVCLAEALQYAHDRGLVHLDLKPSNVLLTADAQPMLLDFHVARAPLTPDGPPPAWFGGTPGYMSPEQEAALAAINEGRPPPQPVDGRSDVYSLGVVLYEALGGRLPESAEAAPPLCRSNPQVSVGLADVIARCLEPAAEDRYADMAALADDLRRHLADLPLRGVRNRSLAERWRKWRRRRPHRLAAAGMLLAVLGAVGAVAIGAVSHFVHRTGQARIALRTGQAQVSEGRYAEAVGTFQRGLSLAQGVPTQGDLARELGRQARVAELARAEAERGRAVQELHALADRVRFLHGVDVQSGAETSRLEGCCRQLWAKRGLILQRLGAGGHGAEAEQVRDDLLDLAILWADLLERVAPAADRPAARASALQVLDEAEALFGPSPVLAEERRLRSRSARPADGGGMAAVRCARRAPGKAWEHYALGRALLRAGDLDRAAKELEQAVRLRPQGLWPNFYQGTCAYRLGRHEDAVAAFSVCIGSAPEAAGCFYNRALAHAALGRDDRALFDYDQALRLDPTFTAAALNRGMLHFQAGRHDAALADLRRALELGADPVVAHYDLALVELARGARTAAVNELQGVLRRRPDHEEARKLLTRLQAVRGGDK